jgi:hypothetical protein
MSPQEPAWDADQDMTVPTMNLLNPADKESRPRTTCDFQNEEKDIFYSVFLPNHFVARLPR